MARALFCRRCLATGYTTSTSASCSLDQALELSRVSMRPPTKVIKAPDICHGSVSGHGPKQPLCGFKATPMNCTKAIAVGLMPCPKPLSASVWSSTWLPCRRPGNLCLPSISHTTQGHTAVAGPTPGSNKIQQHLHSSLGSLLARRGGAKQGSRKELAKQLLVYLGFQQKANNLLVSLAGGGYQRSPQLRCFVNGG